MTVEPLCGVEQAFFLRFCLPEHNYFVCLCFSLAEIH